jgi:hypothetical protein
MYQLAEHLGQPLDTILGMTVDEFNHWFTYLHLKNQKLKEASDGNKASSGSRRINRRR